ncbi:MAG: hypothetical protein KBC02_00015 [Candidatus Pacebacteria bacterium]|nr:hypothetical protein [Candidatus Paceibacterota bacterium]
MPSHLENPFRPPIPAVVDYEKEAHAIGLLLGPKAEAAYRKRHAHDLSDPSVSVSVGLTAEEQAQMNEKSESLLTPERREQIREGWMKFFAEVRSINAEDLMDSMEIHDDGSVSLTGNMHLSHYTKTAPIFPTEIRELTGNLYLDGLKSAEHLVLPSTLTGNLYLHSLESAEHLVLPSTLTGDLYLNGLKSAELVVLPSTLTGDLYLNDLESAEHFVLPAHVSGVIYLNALPVADLASVKAARPDLVSQIRTSF